MPEVALNWANTPKEDIEADFRKTGDAGCFSRTPGWKLVEGVIDADIGSGGTLVVIEAVEEVS